MPYFLTSQNTSVGSEIEIGGDEAAHILLSHRIKAGERIKLQSPDGNRFWAEVVKPNKKSILVKMLEQLEVPQELPVRVSLFQAVVSEKALDFIFQKATELGAAEIILFNSEKVAAKMSHDQFAKKLPRWEKILWEAAKQCERGKIPALSFLSTMDEVIDKARALNVIYLLDVSGQGLRIKDIGYQTLGLVTGPEGGFTPLEIERLQTLLNITTLKLSPFVLRADTAAIAGLAAVIQNTL